MTRAQIVRRLVGVLRPLAPLMAVSVAARIVNQGLGVAIPGVAAGLVVGYVTRSGVGGLLALLAVMAALKGTFRYVEQFTGHAVAFRLLAELRIDTFRKIVPLAPAGLEEERTGDLVTRVVGDIDRVEPFFAHTIAPLAGAVVVPILAFLGMAIWVDPVVAAVFLPFPALMLLAAPWVSAGRVAKLSARAREQLGETAALFTDAVQGAREVAVFEAGDTMAARVERQSDAGASTRKALARISALRSGVGDLLAAAAVVAVAAIAADRFDADVIDLASLAAAVVVAWAGTTPVRALEGIVPDLEQAIAAAARIFALSDREPPVSSDSPADTGPSTGSVRFRKVTVEFEGATSPALVEVDADIAENSYVAVVGPSGSGKSTLVELLVRFRDPIGGTVEIGGMDIRQINRSRLRSEVMVVPQRPEIFYGTIAENLLMARPGATEAELWEALDRVELGSWARSLDNRLETIVGELGETLSGGQRQRLALARAFLRDPRILVLDEATSELDRETERVVLDELRREQGRRTLVVVAHRIESVVDADETLVLDRGVLVERGSHRDLIDSGGVYAGLWRQHLDVLAFE
ncbi:MAG TPA: thiol reductant ABC exporter subunit CydC [Acidimicrobiia bacterium]|nr:thiol reductant ABC exporter subunit CydC [Acidimicrobiia bacterium]